MIRIAFLHANYNLFFLAYNPLIIFVNLLLLSSSQIVPTKIIKI